MPRAPAELENLLFASFLVLGGARIKEIRPSAHLSAILLDMEAFSPDRLVTGLQRLVEDLDGLAESDGAQINWVLEGSLLGRLDLEYRDLKRVVSRQKRGRR